MMRKETAVQTNGPVCVIMQVFHTFISYRHEIFPVAQDSSGQVASNIDAVSSQESAKSELTSIDGEEESTQDNG